MTYEERQKKIENLKKLIGIYERNYTCLESCDHDRYEECCIELAELEAE